MKENGDASQLCFRSTDQLHYCGRDNNVFDKFMPLGLKYTDKVIGNLLSIHIVSNTTISRSMKANKILASSLFPSVITDE